MIGRFPLIAAICATMLASGCRAETSVDLLYKAMTRPTQPVAFMVRVNGEPTPLGVMPLVQGLEDGLPVSGNNGTTMTVPADSKTPERTMWQVSWIDYPSGQGWQADVALDLRDFPEDPGSTNEFIQALNSQIDSAFGPSDGRFYRVLLRFEPGGVLTFWTPSAELLAGDLGRLADWRDYIQLAAVCAAPADDLLNDRAFESAAKDVQSDLARSTATIRPDGSTHLTCDGLSTRPAQRNAP